MHLHESVLNGAECRERDTEYELPNARDKYEGRGNVQQATEPRDAQNHEQGPHVDEARGHNARKRGTYKTAHARQSGQPAHPLGTHVEHITVKQGLERVECSVSHEGKKRCPEQQGEYAAAKDDGEARGDIPPGSGITRWRPVRRREGRLPHVIGAPIELTRLPQSLDPPSGNERKRRAGHHEQKYRLRGSHERDRPTHKWSHHDGDVARKGHERVDALELIQVIREIGGVRARDGLGHAPCEPEHSGPDVDAHDARARHLVEQAARNESCHGDAQVEVRSHTVQQTTSANLAEHDA